MNSLVQIITSKNNNVRNTSIDVVCANKNVKQLLQECDSLEKFWRETNNLYEKVRALFFLYSLHRFYLSTSPNISDVGKIPFEGYTSLLQRRFEEAIEIFLNYNKSNGINQGVSSALASSYYRLGFQKLADQVRKSVKSIRGNQWMFRIGHPFDYPLRVKSELLIKDSSSGLFPVLQEKTPVRMDLTHSGWSDIFFLGMDFPEGARVLNISIDLKVIEKNNHDLPKPPIETYFRIIDKPIIKLTSIDLDTSVELTNINEVFDFAKDYLGLLKAALIASGLVLPGMEGTNQPLTELLSKLVTPGFGIELVSKVNNIPKGSRLAVSTNLLASLIAVCMRATGQTKSFLGELTEKDRRLIAARSILGEWLGGSGGGWQDSGGLWPGLKTIVGVIASETDPEFKISNGCLLPKHVILSNEDLAVGLKKKLHDSLVLVHGGMAQDVGPVLEMVTEKYLLRSRSEWLGRKKAIKTFDEIVGLLKNGNIKDIGKATQNNFEGPIQTIIPWASNVYTELLIKKVKKRFGRDFWGFWMLGGMSGGGMGFIFNPIKKSAAKICIQEIMNQTMKELIHAIPFAMNPVVYDFSINEKGSFSEILKGSRAILPVKYYALTVPSLLLKQNNLTDFQRSELAILGSASKSNREYSEIVQLLFDRMLPSNEKSNSLSYNLNDLLKLYGFDKETHEQIRLNLKNGRIGLAQNRLSINTKIHDVNSSDVFDLTKKGIDKYYNLGLSALKNDEVAVFTLAAGSGSRWTKGAGVVKGINPFYKFEGIHRTFIEIHLAKSRKTSRLSNKSIPHIISTSYLTHKPIEEFLKYKKNYNYKGRLLLSPGKSVGLRLIPTVRDLRFAWEEMPQQILDERAQKVIESLRNSLIGWAESKGEASDYTDNLPLQCLHPMGHWYEFPNLLKNGVLLKLLNQNPNLKHVLMHNIDTLGTDINPYILGYHIEKNKALSVEVISRNINDRGGGLAKVDGHLRIVEGLAFPKEELEFDLTYYNTNTFWININKILKVFGLTREDLNDGEKVAKSIRSLASRMPTYVTLKEVKKRWGKGQEDIFPVAQFEKIWGDITALPEVSCNYIKVNRFRGQQLKEPGQLDGWVRDGSAELVNSLCDWR
ncbi:MAG: UTP--glucose-1-phosphate uridylyltransferase [Ignavibacteriae bacterium]|nr:UTP--glucose-1-phosphate uridylyltransferase [Ignavibacteriota bacterium]